MSAERSAPFYGWRMVAMSFVAYNAGLTVVMNAFGPAMPVLERELGASRASVSTAFGLYMLTVGVLAPVVGNITQVVRLRTLMMAGAAINAFGFLLLNFAQSLTQVLLIYGAILGTGTCMMAIIAAPNLVSRWFVHDRGKALAIGLLQLTALVVAPTAAGLLSFGGRSALYLALAAFFALLVPILHFVIDWPEDVGQTARQAPSAEGVPTSTLPAKTSREILSDYRFWFANIVIGCFTAAGVTLSSHGPAIAATKGVPMTVAATLLSAMGAGTLIGAVVFGWLIDRIGPFRALIAALVLASSLWLVFAIAPSMPVMLGAAFFMGVAMGPTAALHAACLNEIFGPASFGRAMGYSFFVKLPFLVGPAPLAGWLYDMSGGYRTVCIIYVTVEATAALFAVVLARGHERRTSVERLTAGAQPGE